MSKKVLLQSVLYDWPPVSLIGDAEVWLLLSLYSYTIGSIRSRDAKWTAGETRGRTRYRGCRRDAASNWMRIREGFNVEAGSVGPQRSRSPSRFPSPREDPLLAASSLSLSHSRSLSLRFLARDAPARLSIPVGSRRNTGTSAHRVLLLGHTCPWSAILPKIGIFFLDRGLKRASFQNFEIARRLLYNIIFLPCRAFAIKDRIEQHQYISTNFFFILLI